MRAVYFRVINDFIRSPFKILALSGLIIVLNFFLWLNKDTSIPDSGFADLSSLFYHLPWLLMVVIPSLTMTFVVDDFKDDMHLYLFSKPINSMGYWCGHFLSITTIVLVFIGLTLTNVYSISQLASIPENVDYQQIAASYIGIILLSILLINIGLFAASNASQNASAMLLGLLLSFVLYGMPSLIGNLLGWQGDGNYWLDYLSLESHLEFLNRGIMKWNTIIYFLSLSILFAVLSIRNVDNKIISD